MLGLLLVLATLALYNPAARHPFVNYDDDRYVTDNAHVHAGLHWQTLVWAFSSFDEANWHPLTWLVHALDYELFGTNPAGHHYVNVLLHALNVMLLFWMLWRATGATWPSWMVAALFAIHPINVESVVWVAELKSVLSMTFLLFALLSYGWYARKPAPGRYLVTLAMFACGLMAKPMVISLPFLLLLWDYWPLRRVDGAQAVSADAAHNSRLSGFLRLVLEKLPFFALAAVSAAITIKAQRAGDAIGSVTQYPISARLGNALVSYARYLGKALWPVNLAPMYPFRIDLARPLYVIPAGLLLIAITALIFALRRNRALLVGWLWFLGALVPMIGLVQVGRQAMADRYVYLPFIGLFLMLCFGVQDWFGGKPGRALPLTGISVVILAALSALAYRQIAFWSDNVILWSHTIAVTGPNYIAEDNLGGALLERGQMDDAMAHFRAAAAIEPLDLMSRLNLAADEQRQGHYEQAIEQCTQLLHMTSDRRLRASAFSDMGFAYRALGNSDRARQSLQAAVSLRPRAVRAWLGLGLLAQKSGDYAAAVEDYSQVVSIQNWDLGYLLLARSLEQTGHTQEAEAAMEQAKRLSPNFDELQKTADALQAQ